MMSSGTTSKPTNGHLPPEIQYAQQMTGFAARSRGTSFGWIGNLDNYLVALEVRMFKLSAIGITLDALF